MKSPSQIIFLIVAFVGLVAGLTYLSQWIPRSPVVPTKTNTGPTQPTEEVRKLDFPIEGIQEPIECESREPGHRDFLFRNNQEGAVEIGLKECIPPNLGVEVALLTPEQAEAFDKGLPDSLEWKKIKIGDGVVALPKGQAAVLRSSWKDQVTPTPVGMMLWCQDAGKEDTRKRSNTLGYRLMVQPVMTVMPPLNPEQPARFAKELDADETATHPFFCLSSTRKELKPKVVVLARDGKPDPCFTYSITPMSEGELKQLMEVMKSNPQGPQKVNYLCGYKVEVTVHETAPDGKTRLDLGTFARRINFSCDADNTPIQGTITGKVLSDIKVASAEGRIDFKIFDPKEDGNTVRVTLDAPPNVNLKLADGSEPDYLEVKLERGEEPGRWKLEVTIPPNKARNGPLPRESCVMLECTGERARKVRVPVAGLASVKN